MNKKMTRKLDNMDFSKFCNAVEEHFGSDAYERLMTAYTYVHKAAYPSWIRLGRALLQFNSVAEEKFLTKKLVAEEVAVLGEQFFDYTLERAALTVIDSYTEE